MFEFQDNLRPKSNRWQCLLGVTVHRIPANTDVSECDVADAEFVYPYDWEDHVDQTGTDQTGPVIKSDVPLILFYFNSVGFWTGTSDTYHGTAWECETEQIGIGEIMISTGKKLLEFTDKYVLLQPSPEDPIMGKEGFADGSFVCMFEVKYFGPHDDPDVEYELYDLATIPHKLSEMFLGIKDIKPILSAE